MVNAAGCLASEQHDPLPISLSDLIRQERSGYGPYPVETAEHLIRLVPTPVDVMVAYGLVGAAGEFEDSEGTPDGPWTSVAAEIILDPNETIYTAQKNVSGTHLARIVPELKSGSGVWMPDGGEEAPWDALPRIYRDVDGRRWILDGHHRVIGARIAGRAVYALELDAVEVAEISRWTRQWYDDDGWDEF